MDNKLPFEIIAALRFLREGLTQTLMIIIGVSVGVSVIVFMSALMTGMQNNIVNRVLSSQAQVVVLPRKEVTTPVMQDGPSKIIRIVQSRSQRKLIIDQWQKLRDALVSLPTTNVVSPMASGPALISRGATTRSISLMGVQPDQYFHFVDIPGYIIAGTSHFTSTDILIGKDLSEDLGVHTGDKLNIASGAGVAVVLTIVGIFDIGNKGFNSRSTLVALSTAQNVLGMSAGVSSIDVTLKDPYSANDVADAFAAAHPVEVDSWIRTNAQFFSAINAQSITITVIRGAVALSVALGIASVLAVSVVQRSKEIGILRAMGASQGQIMRVFLVQGGIVGLVGSIIGSVLAWLILQVFVVFARNADGTPFFVLTIPASLYALTAVFATLCGVLAAVVPARNASKLDPVEAIRG